MILPGKIMSRLRKVLVPVSLDAGLLVLACVLFALSFPNPLVIRGIPILAWFAYIPVFLLLRRISLPWSFLWGALYGYFAYNLFNYWLNSFNAIAGLVVGVIYLVYFTILFPLLKLCTIFFPKKGYILQWLIWVAYEYLRTLGFLGYAYGITGYSQWSFVPLIQIAGIFGVWGVSALVVFPSIYLGNAMGNRLQSLQGVQSSWGACGLWVAAFVKREWLPLCLWVLAFTATMVYGLTLPKNYSKYPKVNIALIQSNEDPYKDGNPAYRHKLEENIKLSNQALADKAKKPDLVLWSETAFAPRIYWHIHYRNDQDSYELVEELLSYLRKQDVPFLIGNDDGRLEPDDEGQYVRVDYNAALLFEKGVQKGIYRKIHLVPFTEHFPWATQLPGFYQMILDAGNHMWKQGTEYTVFDTGKFKFSVPICFEDTFGEPSRNFVADGAEVLANITNDAWSGSETAQMQHATMAAFRAVENRRSIVRATATGQTCAFDPSGRLLSMAKAFTPVYLTVTVPLVKNSDPLGQTFYTRHGNFLPQIFIILSGLLLILGVFRFIIVKKVKTVKKDEEG
jgi:apolipoprotein N-acyltransferase